MKKINVIRKMMIGVIVLCGLSLSSTAQPRERFHPCHPGDHQRIDLLNLTDEQKAEIKQIRLEKAREIQPLKDELKINKAKINALIHADNPEMKEIVSLVEANSRILTQIRVREIDSRIKIRALLSDDQKVLLDARDGRMQRHREMTELRPPRQLPERRRF